MRNGILIAGIGARATPDFICTDMEYIAKEVVKSNGWIRSGHAEGADYAFEIGAGNRCIVYLPSKGFNSKLPMLGKQYQGYDYTNLEFTLKYHPNPGALSPFVRQLMLRSGAQILGINGDSPVDAVVCWTPDGKASGGTGQGIRIAMDYGIPVFNMRVMDVGSILEGKLNRI